MKKIKPISFILFLLSFNLSAAGYSDGGWDYKLPNEIGNLFKTEEKTDRKYGKAGQLLKDETYSYSYDEVGNLIEKESIAGTWKYRWSQGGMLKQVVRPDNKKVDFTYDALGRRLTKTYQDQTTHFVWDGNVPLHEWTSSIDETITSVNENGEAEISIPENLTTWIFEDGTFIPMAKLHGDKSYSIITDHLGTPTEAYDEEGEKVWSRELGIYGQTLKETGVENFIPFKYQGQYEDLETGLCYNRFRYYSPESGTYVSQDPIKFAGGGNFYAYVLDSNSWVDAFGLSGDLTVVRLDGNAGGNHYALLYDKGGSQQITDLIGADGETTTVRDRPNTKLSLDDVADVDKKVIPVTGNLEDAIKRAKSKFNNKKYKLNSIDCFQYIESIIRKANPSARIKGATNAAKFKDLSC